jgi:hypothetical protein
MFFTDCAPASAKRTESLFLTCSRRDADAPGIGEALEARCDVHAFAVDPLAFDPHVAEMGAHAELHPAFRRVCGVQLGDGRLDVLSAANAFERGGERRQEVVAREVDEPPAMTGNDPLDAGAAGVQHHDRRALVLGHQPAVADHVGVQDADQPMPARFRPAFVGRVHRPEPSRASFDAAVRLLPRRRLLHLLDRSNEARLHAPMRSISTRVPRSEQPGDPMSSEGWSWK